MHDSFWLTKILTLVKFLNLETIKELVSNQQDQANKYLNALNTVIAQSPNEAIVNASKVAQLINDASDRAIFNHIETEENADEIVVKHLLSGKKLNLNLETTSIRNKSLTSLPKSSETGDELPCSLQELFWWLWRCLPEAIANKTSPNSLLISASDNLPDASMWSDASLAAALAGALVGYQDDETESRPQLVIFSFSPVQELIKASRKMRDFWAGSWLLHYLSAHVCWNIASKYGADSLVYPSLYQQPLIDHWLLDKYPNFNNNEWIIQPNNRALLTAGFPNVIVAVLPKSEVKGAMQTARQNLLKEWINVSDLVYQQLKEWGWMPDLAQDDPTWNGWLKSQWQTYWTALPLGREDEKLEKTIIDQEWVDKQNQACNLRENLLFSAEEQKFINAVLTPPDTPKINVGSWWPYTFDQLRFALSSVKKARTWKIPTAFTMRSTVSGVGSVVTPNSINLKRDSKDKTIIEERQQREENIQQYEKVLGLFDGKEQLNATETVKRGLHFVLPSLINISNLDSEDELEERIAASYPDLCSGVAGWLRTQPESAWEYYNKACQEIVKDFPWTKNRENQTKATAFMPWGIPWIDEKHNNIQFRRRYNPRLLNAGWAIEDYPIPEHLRQDKVKAKQNKQEELKKLKLKIDSYFSPGNNPADWYVIAVGDGDGMGEWLKGTKLEKYEQYLGDGLLNNPPNEIAQPLAALKKVPKRMGPSTHNALSRALLDFSNRLVPYLTEERYAGRLIYSGGDDVFAYTNLWEWDKWLWDVQQCFCGAEDPHSKFNNTGDYWQWKEGDRPDSIPNRPLFTMGSKATISFGLVIAHHSVPLAITLENVWQAEKEAKEHFAFIENWHNLPIKFWILLLDLDCIVGILFLYENLKEKKPKDAVQVRVLFGNGNTIAATSKFEVFHHWQELLSIVEGLESSERNSLPGLLELAAQIWTDHPAPSTEDAIKAWVKAFCQRRDILKLTQSTDFSEKLRKYLILLIQNSQEKVCKREQAEEWHKQIQNWLKLAAFVLRNREITINVKNNKQV